MQEALGLVIGALAALLVLSSGTNEASAPTLARHGAANRSKVGQWISISIALVSCVLILSMAAWSVLGVPASAELARNSMQQQENNRYVAPGPKAAPFFRIPSDDLDSPRASGLVVKEDGKPLGPAHTLHADIAEKGGGSFSHWDSWVVFSSSDDSDPRENGRNYVVAFSVFPSPTAWLLALLMFLGLLALRPTRNGFAVIAVFISRIRPAVRALCVAVVFVVVAWGFAGLVETSTVDAAAIQHQEGAAYVVPMPRRSPFVELTGDSVKRRSAAALQVLEDKRALGPENIPHVIISQAGRGRYSHWQDSVVFSTSDSTDPRANGRQYQFKFRTYPGLFSWLAAFLAIALLVVIPRTPAERLIAARAPPAHIAVTVLFVGAFALALAYLSQRFFTGIDAPVNMLAPVFGSASVPYSDALLWILGGLQFLLEGSDVALTPYLYRPTIGILFGSVMAVFNSAEAVPTFFFLSLLCVLALVSLIASGTRIALMFGLWAMLCVALPGAPLWHVLVNAPMPDLPALLFSVSGLLFVVLFLNRRAGVFALCIGLLLLGIATAIRGALLPAGFLLIVLCCWQRGWKNVGPLAIAGLASFLTPFILDSFLQRHYHINNNAVVHFYCVVHDAARFWSAACDEMYRRQGVTAAGAIGDYLRFSVSPTGMQFLFSGFIERVRHDLASLSHPAFAVALVLAALANIRSQVAAASNRHPILSSRTYLARWANERWSLWISLIAVIASLWIATAGPSELAVALALVCMLLSAVRRDFIALACFTVYLSGLVMMTAIGVGPLFGINTDRITATYSFALPLALLALVLGNEAPRVPHSDRFDSHWGDRAAVGGAAAIAFLYAAVWVWPSTWRSTFESEVVGKKAALKVLDSAAVDRSGYYAFMPNMGSAQGAGVLVYTKRDEFPVGSVRHYQRFLNDQFFVGSFLEPNAMLP